MSNESRRLKLSCPQCRRRGEFVYEQFGPPAPGIMFVSLTVEFKYLNTGNLWTSAFICDCGAALRDRRRSNRRVSIRLRKSLVSR